MHRQALAQASDILSRLSGSLTAKLKQFVIWFSDNLLVTTERLSKKNNKKAKQWISDNLQGKTTRTTSSSKI